MTTKNITTIKLKLARFIIHGYGCIQIYYNIARMRLK